MSTPLSLSPRSAFAATPKTAAGHRGRAQRVTAVAALCLCVSFAALATPPQCQASSGTTLTPVIELYTSEGCSSCPPADQWLSGLKGQPVVAQAFHVAYWDTIGWKDRFAQATFSARQKDIAALNLIPAVEAP